ncbi:MAG: hypothetical protein KJO70_08780 [Gammaproteobacteria bacterium]|nr:hypothetical protein [Gammaproteobacteria bacterium]NNK34352.1 hypothetical protein [Xanthomonadales bacterium]
MDTRFIETMIEHLGSSHEPDPELYDLLASVADRQGAEAGPADLDRAAAFVLDYIGQVPYMIKVASTSAVNVGLEKEMRRILETVASYWKEGDDIIPDELGVIGLLDDAYCSLTLLQAVSDNYRLITGKHLFPDDLTLANQAMHRIIGEPYVSELDTLVVRTMKEARLLDAVKKLAGKDKRIHLDANSTIWNHGPAGQLDLAGLEKLGLL